MVSILTASALLCGIASTAHAKLIGFNGTLSIQMPWAFKGPPIVATGSGNAVLNSSAGIGGHLVSLQILPNTVSATGGVVPITDPNMAPLVAVGASPALGTGPLRPVSGAASSGPGLTQNVLPVQGNLGICILFPNCSAVLTE